MRTLQKCLESEADFVLAENAFVGDYLKFTDKPTNSIQGGCCATCSALAYGEHGEVFPQCSNLSCMCHQDIQPGKCCEHGREEHFAQVQNEGPCQHQGCECMEFSASSTRQGKCCEKCEIYLSYKLPREGSTVYQCRDRNCPCHTPSAGWEVVLAPEGTALAEFQKERTRAISEMFDNMREDGIYPTGKFFARLDKCVEKLIADEIAKTKAAIREKLPGPSVLNDNVFPYEPKHYETHAEADGWNAYREEALRIIDETP